MKPITYETNENGCHICTSHKCFNGVPRTGYARVSVNGKETKLHRYIYEQHYGKIPEGLLIRHMCGDKRCINPEHLAIGTNSDNSRDKVKLREIPLKLTLDDVNYIRSSSEKGYELSAKFNVAQSTISRIRHGKRWGFI